MPIEENIQARNVAEEAYGFVSELIRESDLLSVDAVALAWRLLGDMIDATTNTNREPPKPNPVRISKMADFEARNFETKEMPWGKYKGREICQVPLHYLEFVANREDPFVEDVKRYLESQLVQQELEFAEED